MMMGDNKDDLADWLTQSLATLSIEDETFSEYIIQICDEDSIEDAEKEEIITEFLSEATDKPVATFVTSLLARTQARKHAAKEREEAERIRAIENAKEKEQEALRKEASTSESAATKKTLSEEEKRARQRVLMEYGWETEDVEGGEGTGGVGADKGGENPLLTKNRNAEIVKEAEQAKRTKAQTEHQKIVARNKEMQEKQRLEKEKAKKGTVKKEKRRM
ncbi:hypothetical protein HK104_005004 [Borealophlyctis nickersoniae]|nr:hypothetical protein HK104_005004 [Borealophlyctis nickersoniae]